MWQFVGYFILFIFCSAVVYTWGLLKSRKEQQQLTEMLTRKCRRIIRKKLKQEKTITVCQAAKAIEGVTVSLFHSRKRFGVTDAMLFAGQMLDQMQQEGQICFMDPKKKIFSGNPY